MPLAGWPTAGIDTPRVDAELLLAHRSVSRAIGSSC